MAWETIIASGNGGNCFQVDKDTPGVIKLRESDNPDTVIHTTPENFRALVASIKAGQFNDI